jgi:hypothetical protein
VRGESRADEVTARPAGPGQDRGRLGRAQPDCQEGPAWLPPTPPKNFATNFATIPNHNPSHPITTHPRSPGTPDMSNPALGEEIRA